MLGALYIHQIFLNYVLYAYIFRSVNLNSFLDFKYITEDHESNDITHKLSQILCVVIV